MRDRDHEIYLGIPRRTAPERPPMILRQPISYDRPDESEEFGGRLMAP